MITIYQAAFFGLLGGITRAVVGVLKNKNKFVLSKSLITLFASGIIGIFAGLLVIQDIRVVLLVGYAGTDLIEGIFKILVGKPAGEGLAS